jgi:uncharacterized protein
MQRLRIALWPRHSWGRSSRYFWKRVLRLSGSPHAIALGFAAGVGVSFTPFIGFHFILGGILALVLGGNLFASALGTAIGNPLTFPFIWWSTYLVGSQFVDGAPHHTAATDLFAGFGQQTLGEILPILTPMVIGALPLGSLAAAASYIIVLYLVRAFKHARAQRLASRRSQSAGNDITHVGS